MLAESPVKLSAPRLLSVQSFFPLVAHMVKNICLQCGRPRFSESGRSPGKGHGNPLQYSCLENPMDRGAWWAMVHGVAKIWTWPKRLSIQLNYISSNWTVQIFCFFLNPALEDCMFLRIYVSLPSCLICWCITVLSNLLQSFVFLWYQL